VGLLGDPDKNGAQNDVWIFDAAWEYASSKRHQFGAVLVARDGFKKNDSPVTLRGVYRYRLGVWSVSAGLAAGLNGDADDFSADLFARRDFRLWNTNQRRGQALTGLVLTQ
jgi:hypothetical protein